MPMMKLPKDLANHEFRGVFTTEEVKNFFGIKPDAVYGSEQWVYLAIRKAPKGGNVGDAHTECSDVFIGLTPAHYKSGAHYSKIEHKWCLPDKKEHPELKLDADLHILYCHVICGFFSTGSLYSPVDLEEMGAK